MSSAARKLEDARLGEDRVARKLASGILSSLPGLASGLRALQVANDNGENARCYDEVASEPLIARDYDPTIGRWVSKDSAHFGGGLNFYVYANNDPVNFIDVTGYGPTGASWGARIGAVVGGVVGFDWGAGGGVIVGSPGGAAGVVGGGVAGDVGGALVGAGIGAVGGAVIGSGLEDALGAIADFASERSRAAKPKGCPAGTKPIDQTPWSKHHQPIKEGVGAGPKDWTGISPDDHVITGDGDGNAVDHGPAEDYLP